MKCDDPPGSRSEPELHVLQPSKKRFVEKKYMSQRFLIWRYGGYLLTNSKRCDTCKGKIKKIVARAAKKPGA